MKLKACCALPTAMVLTAGMSVLSVQAGGSGTRGGDPKQAPGLTSLRTLATPSADQGGIAGVTSLAENFETGFTVGSGCLQKGWDGSCGAGPPPFGFLIEENTPPDPRFGSFSATFETTGDPADFILAMTSPTLPTPETGRLDFDVLISDVAANYTAETIPCNTTGCLVHTRLSFDPSGSIDVLQLLPANCEEGEFVPSGATWSAGVAMRIGIQVDGLGDLRVFKDNVQIFDGDDISVVCAPINPDGIGAVVIAVVNTPAGTILTLDNVGGAGPAPCVEDIDGDGSVEVDDLIAVILGWGCTEPPACPADIAPPPVGDGIVDVDDLVAIILGWGPC